MVTITMTKEEAKLLKAWVLVYMDDDSIPEEERLKNERMMNDIASKIGRALRT